MPQRAGASSRTVRHCASNAAGTLAPAASITALTGAPASPAAESSSGEPPLSLHRSSQTRSPSTTISVVW
jgi:hypothetical protein